METREIKEKVLRIMALAMEVSTIRNSLDKTSYPDVIVTFNGCVSNLDVLVYENGIKPGIEPDRRWYVILYRGDTSDKSKENYSNYGCKELDNIIAYLEDLKNA